MKAAFDDLYGDQFKRVRNWYAVHGGVVSVIDVSLWLSELAEDLIGEPVEPEDV